MAEKNFWQDKWLKDQFNERNAGQRNDSSAAKQPANPDPALPNPDDVLRTMLNTPPQPHSPAARKKSKPKPKQRGK